MIKVCENGSLVPAWPLSGPVNACLLLFCRPRHWQSLSRQWLSHQRKEPAADGGRPHQTRLSRGPPAREPWQQTPRRYPHLQLSSRRPTAALSATASAEKRCTAGTPPPPPPHRQVALVLTSSRPRHKGPLKCLRMLYGCMTGGGRGCWGGVTECTGCEWDTFRFTFNLEPSHAWFKSYFKKSERSGRRSFTIGFNRFCGEVGVRACCTGALPACTIRLKQRK